MDVRATVGNIRECACQSGCVSKQIVNQQFDVSSLACDFVLSGLPTFLVG